jgi:hypothetical protein
MALHDAVGTAVMCAGQSDVEIAGNRGSGCAEEAAKLAFEPEQVWAAKNLMS